MLLRWLIAQCTLWVPCGLSLFLFTLDYLSEHSLLYPGLILLIAQSLPVTCILLLFIYLTDPIQMSSSPISPLELFQGII